MPFNFLHIIDILGTFAFAVSGAFAAMEKKLDPFGVLILSFVTAVGGGTIRDVLLGDLPVAWLTNNISIWVILIAATGTLLFGTYLKQLTTTLFLFDALGLGLFTMVGLQKGLAHGFSTGICVALGTITACFGGVIRDVLLNNVPLIFRKEIYASACIAGGAFYFLLPVLHIEENTSRFICIAFIFLLRLLAVRFKWSLPQLYK